MAASFRDPLSRQVDESVRINMITNMGQVIIGAKRGGTQEQCSQKLLELAEIFRKIIRIINIFDV